MQYIPVNKTTVPSVDMGAPQGDTTMVPLAFVTDGVLPGSFDKCYVVSEQKCLRCD